jgi:hypothetical protein
LRAALDTAEATIEMRQAEWEYARGQLIGFDDQQRLSISVVDVE